MYISFAANKSFIKPSLYFASRAKSVNGNFWITKLKLSFASRSGFKSFFHQQYFRNDTLLKDNKHNLNWDL